MRHLASPGAVAGQYHETLNPQDPLPVDDQYTWNPGSGFDGSNQHGWNPDGTPARGEHGLNPETVEGQPQHGWNPATDGTCVLPNQQ